jgi:hypothetical protein
MATHRILEAFASISLLSARFSRARAINANSLFSKVRHLAPDGV